MKLLLAGCALVAAAFGCQRSAGSTAAPVVPAYRDDIARLCDVVVQSGADRLAPGVRLHAQRRSEAQASDFTSDDLGRGAATGEPIAAEQSDRHHSHVGRAGRPGVPR